MTFSVSLTGGCPDKAAVEEFHRAIAEAAADLVAAGGTIGGSINVDGTSHAIDGKAPAGEDEAPSAPASDPGEPAPRRK